MKMMLIAALLCAPAAFGQTMRVSLAEGEVSVAPADGGAARAAPVGTSLAQGDTVETGDSGRVEIEVPGGSIIRLGERTRLQLSLAQPARAFNARLFLGNLWTRVHKLVAGESFTIETENGVAGVRGTEFRIEAAQGQPDVLRVYEGAVQVGEHRVEPGHELRFHRGGTAGPRPFDAQSEKGHRFMEWVKAHEPKDGRGQPGSIRRQRRENRLREKRERRRER